MMMMVLMILVMGYILHMEIEMVWTYKLQIHPVIKLNWWNEIKNTYWYSSNCIDTTSIEWPTLQLNGH